MIVSKSDCNIISVSNSLIPSNPIFLFGIYLLFFFYDLIEVGIEGCLADVIDQGALIEDGLIEGTIDDVGLIAVVIGIVIGGAIGEAGLTDGVIGEAGLTDGVIGEAGLTDGVIG